MSEFDKCVEKFKQSIYQSLGVPAEYLKSSPGGRHMVMVIDERFAYILGNEFEFKVKENKEIYG